MLCLDKTGTITQGKMQVEAVLPLTATYGEETIASILTSYIAHSEDKIQLPKPFASVSKASSLSYAL